MSAQLRPERTIDELKELRKLTGDENGAQRVAFTSKWLEARKWLREKASDLPLEIHNDSAGNTWFTLEGSSKKSLLLGGHLDSVPNGGWLDGCLNVLAGLEVLRRIHGEFAGNPPITIRLVDWADEEGARFGCSLFGSSACSGNLDHERARQLVDANGIKLPDALRQVGIDFERIKECGSELQDAAAYLELHIEQGPVLLDRDLLLGAVLGTFGVRRHTVTFKGQAAHSGSTPMNRRKDAFLPAARMASEIYDIAERSNGGVCTIGSCSTKPGIPTSVVEECRITLDQRHLHAPALREMLEQAQAASHRFAEESSVHVTWDKLLAIEPVLFHPVLTALCSDAIRETCIRSGELPSGPLHDASEMARAGVPTAMMFVQSLQGISHTKLEDTKEEHLREAIVAFDRLASKTMNWIQNTP